MLSAMSVDGAGGAPRPTRSARLFTSSATCTLDVREPCHRPRAIEAIEIHHLVPGHVVHAVIELDVHPRSPQVILGDARNTPAFVGAADEDLAHEFTRMNGCL